ncbi:MAG: transposase [Rickettsiaceae bacterium]
MQNQFYNRSFLLKRKFEYMRKAYWGIDGIWSDRYFVSTVDVNEQIIKKYMEQQGAVDMRQAQLVLVLKPT